MKNLGKKIIYEIYPLSFYDSNNDGLGDIKGIIKKLDYLSLLGVDILWITPIFKSPKNDNGYDISNYLEIDPSFGTMKDVEQLIKEAKKRNIGIMFDMVFNHVSTHSEWYKKALSGNKKYKDYFYIVESQDKQNPPTNWESKFGGSAWQYESAFNGYYLHLFDKTQIDINWNNQEVRDELIKVVNFWIKKGIAGFRFDVINLIGKPKKFKSTNDFGKSQYTDHKKVHHYLKELNLNSFGKHKDLVTVGEMSSTSIKKCKIYSNPKKHQLDMAFNFHHLKVDYKDGQKWQNKPWDKQEFKDIIIEWQTKLARKGWNSIFLNNHDQPRVNSRYGDTKKYWFESSTLFATLMFSLRGTIFLYQGEEIGMTNPNFDKITLYQDVESINAFNILKEQGLKEKEILNILSVKSRDNSRTPMQWNGDKYAGFSKSKPWISVSKNYRDINAKKQINDDQSIFNYYRKLIQLRKSQDVLASGKISFVKTNENTFIIKRKLHNKTIITYLNLTPKTQSIDICEYKNILINNYTSIKNDKLLPFQAIMLEI